MTLLGIKFISFTGKLANGSQSPILKSTKIGPTNGLRIELFLNEPHDLRSLSVSNGARVVVHNQTHSPSFYEGIHVAIGAETYVEVNRAFSSLLEKPYSDCMNYIDITHHPSKLVKSIISTGYAYTQQHCFYACYQFYLIERCGCHDFSSLLPITTFTSQNIRPCLNFTQMTCNAQV